MTGRGLPAAGGELPAAGRELPAAGRELLAGGSGGLAAGREVFAGKREGAALKSEGAAAKIFLAGAAEFGKIARIMAQVKLDFSNKTVPQKLAQAETVISMSTNNPNLSDPNPAVVVTLNARRYTLQVAYANALSKRQAAEQATGALATAERDFDAAVTQYGAFIQEDTGGDRDKILSTGNGVAAHTSTPIALGALEHFGVTKGDEPGELHVDWDNLHGASGYETEVTTDLTGATGWGHRKFSTKSQVDLENLTPRTSYLVRSRAVGAAGEGPWTDPVLTGTP